VVNAELEKILCVIPAKGTSRRIPRKNMAPVNGKPLVQYSIEHAIAAGVPMDQIVVSSDDNEILEVARNCEVEQRRRPDELCGDLCSTESALLDVFNSRSESMQSGLEAILLLQPTSPIRFKNRVRDCIDIFFDGGYDSLLTVTSFYNFLWHEQSTDDDTYLWVSTYDPQNRPMSQQLGREDYRYFDNGNIYITRVSLLLEENCRLGRKICPVPITEIESIQIDRPDELDVLQKIMTGNLQDLT